MLLNLFSPKKSKRKPFKLRLEYLNGSVTPQEKETLIGLAEIFDEYLIKLEEFAYSSNSQLQFNLKDEKVMDMARAELLIIAFKYLDSAARNASLRREAGMLFTNYLGEYIQNLKIKFPTKNFTDVQNFFEVRYKNYNQFWATFQSKDSKDSVIWLESIISLRLFGEIKDNDLGEIYYPDFDGLNQVVFVKYFYHAIIPLMKNIDVCFKNSNDS